MVTRPALHCARQEATPSPCPPFWIKLTSWRSSGLDYVAVAYALPFLFATVDAHGGANAGNAALQATR
eukprot:364865-Chlamydomonas_euryale.AAC.3